MENITAMDEELLDNLRMGPRSSGPLAYFPLGFKDPCTEQDYLAECKPRLAQCTRICGLAAAFICIAHTYIERRQYNYLPPQNVSHAIFFTYRMGLFVLGILCALIPRRLPETSVLFCCIYALTPMSKTRCSWLASENANTSWSWEQQGVQADTLPGMFAIVGLSYFFNLFPIRVKLSWPIAAYCPAMYGLFSWWLPEDVRDPDWSMVCLLLTLTSLITFHSRRNAELLHRREFFRLLRTQTALISEKILRCEAEFPLDGPQYDRQGSLATHTEDGKSETTKTQAASTVIGQAIAAMSVKFDDPSQCLQEMDVEDLLKEVANQGRKEHWLIEPGDLTIKPGSFLGGGGFGTVVLGQLFGTEVAVKLPGGNAKSPGKALNKWVSILRELRVFRRLRHPNVVFFYGGIVDPIGGDVALVLEFVKGTDLRNYIAPMPKGPGVWSRSQIVLDVCSGLAYMHSQSPPVVHGDLKPANVLIEFCRPDMQGNNNKPLLQRAKLADFGLSPILTSKARIIGSSFRWAAPEYHSDPRGFAKPAFDIFSFGYVVYFVACGEHPLSELSNAEIESQAASGVQPVLKWPKKVPLRLEYEAICRGCTPVDPQKRMTSMELHAMSHSLLRQVQSELEFGPEQNRENRLFVPRAKRNLELQRNAEAERQANTKTKSMLTSAEFACADMQLQPTTLLGKRHLLLDIIMQMNYPLHCSCCSWHSGLKDVIEAATELSAASCVKDFGPDAEGQCPQCGLLIRIDDLILPAGDCKDELRFNCDACMYDGVINRRSQYSTSTDRRQEQQKPKRQSEPDDGFTSSAPSTSTFL